MSKRIVLAVFFFMVMAIIIPLAQSILFSNRSTGKITINEQLSAPYLLGSDKQYMLVFFGYVGCTKVCTPILHELDAMYESKNFDVIRDRVELVFVNLMPELEPDQPDLFAKSFNPHFRGIYLTQSELMNIDRELGVFFSKSISDTTELDHSDHLYLVEKKKDGTLVLRSIYTTHPIVRQFVIDDISLLRKEKE